MRAATRRVQGLRGETTVPGDKSISHRAAILGALARGETRIQGFLPGADCERTLACLAALGVKIRRPQATEVIVEGRGGRLVEPAEVLEVGNSGTLIRLLLGVLAGQPFFSVLTGDASICRRPMGRVREPLVAMGAKIWGRQEDTLAPLAIKGGELQGITYHSPVASAQVKTAVLLAGLRAQGETAVFEPALSRDHTERMLAAFGVPVARLAEPGSGPGCRVSGGATLTGREVNVPGDLSSAAFLLIAALITPCSQLLLRNVGVNPTRAGLLEVLVQMGADLKVLNPREEAGEPVADLLVRSSNLRGIEIGGEIIPRLIDEIPILAVAAAMATGTTLIRDAAELRVKESDRIALMVRELGRLGVQCVELPDGMVIEGRGGVPLQGAICASAYDHRVAMSLLVAGLVAEGETQVEEAEAIETSFPGFIELLSALTF